MSGYLRQHDESLDATGAPPGSKRRLRARPLEKRERLRQLTADLESLRKRVEAANRETPMPSKGDDLQSISEALQTAVFDLRHAQAALDWLAHADEVEAAAAAK